MIRDPIVEEVHQARAKLLDACDGDLQKLMDRLKTKEAEHPERLVSYETLKART